MNCYIEDNSVCFRYIRRVSSCGTILFIHGLGESGLCVESLTQYMGSHATLSKWNLFVPDLPGYGRSLPQTPVLSLEMLADFIGKKSALLPRGPVVLMGHSMGGAIGQILTETDNASFCGFINVEGNISTGDCVFSGQAAQNSLSDFQRTGFQRLKDTVFQNGVHDPAQRGYYASMRFADSAQFHRNSRDLIEFSAPETAADRFKRLTLPKLYIAGQPRGICPESMELLRKADAPTAVIRDAGHWPFIDQPESFCDIVSHFLEELSAV